MKDIKNIAPLQCSFCNKPNSEVYRMIHGVNGNICSECVDVCATLVGEEYYRDDFRVHDNLLSEIDLLKPKDIFDKLNDFVIGQDRAKKILSVAVYNHYKRLKFNNKKNSKNGIEIGKSNILLLGPTGVGKTLLAQTLAKIINVPFAIADATSLTEAGYVGEDVETIILRLLQSADYDIDKAQQGIIYIDEIDKITRKTENMSITRDVSGEGVQQALLKIIEGTIAYVQSQGTRKNPSQDLIPIDTSNILFICGGAFSGLDKIIESRKSVSSIGFNANIVTNYSNENFNNYQEVIDQDLFKFGLIHELVGRLPIIATLDKMDEDTIYKVLTQPKNALLLQYKELFILDGIKLTFREEALREIARIVHGRSLGARGLRSYLEDILSDTMFDIPSLKERLQEVVITKDVVKKIKKPQYIFKTVKKIGTK